MIWEETISEDIATPPAAGSQPFAEFSTWMMAIVTATMATCHRRLQVLMHRPSKKWHFNGILVSHQFPTLNLAHIFGYFPEFSGHFMRFDEISIHFPRRKYDKPNIFPLILVSLVACRITSMHPRTWKMEKMGPAKAFSEKDAISRVNGHKGFLPVFYKMVVANEVISY